MSPASDAFTLALQPLIAAEVRNQLSQLAREFLSKHTQQAQPEANSGTIDTPEVPTPARAANGGKRNGQHTPVETA